MLVCKECQETDIEPKITERNGEEYEICPVCGSEDSIKELDEINWQEEIKLLAADRFNENLEINYEIL